MSACPFCGSSVDDHIVFQGGTCPKCFAEVPGEMAPTDPGENVRAAIDRRDRRRAALPAILGLLCLGILVMCTGTVAMAFALWPSPQIAELLDYDRLEVPMPEVVAAVEPPANAVLSGTPRPKPARVAQSEARARPPSTSTPPRPSRAQPAAKPAPARSSGGLDLSIGGPSLRRDANLVLTDPVAIREMIGEEMAAGIPGLTFCYERRLKSQPDFAGRWRIRFTVAQDGTPADAAAEALDAPSPEFEQCVVRHVAGWRFGKISAAQPIAKTLTFRPR